MHPPAVATALTFTFRDAAQSSLLLFGIGVGIICLLVGLQKISRRLLFPYRPRSESNERS